MSARQHMLGCKGAHARRSNNQAAQKLCGFVGKSTLAINSGTGVLTVTPRGGGAKCFLDARIRREQKNATRVYIPTISDARRCLTESIDGLIAAAAITLNDEWRCAGMLAGLGQWPPRSSGGSRPKG